MPELPEVETVRRQLEVAVLGRSILSVWRSGKKLREPVSRGLGRRLPGRTILRLERNGKYLLLGLDEGLTLISHLGMSGRWRFFPGSGPAEPTLHVHLRLRLEGGGELWFDDPRRFGLLRLVPTANLAKDRALRQLGPDPVTSPPTGPALAALGRRAKVPIKSFLLDQKRIAGIGNIYASEILHRARVNPRRRAAALKAIEWEAIARETRLVLEEAIDRMGTTFRSYRTPWDESGSYGQSLFVYDRGGEPCRTCGTPIRRLVQAQRSTYYCPTCQKSR